MSTPYAASTPRTRRIAKEALWIALGQIASIGGTLAGLKILTALLSPSEYGQLALGLTASTLANQVLWGPLVAGATRFYAPARERRRLSAYLGATFGFVMLGIGLLVLVAVAISIIVVIGAAGHWVPLIVAGLAFSVVAGIDSITSGIQTAARQRAVVALHSGIASWARLILAASLLSVVGVSSTIAMWGYVIGTIVVLASQYRFFLPIRQAAGAETHTVEEASGEWRERILGYSWPFVLWGGFCWFQAASDRWALALFGSASDVGIYSVLYQLSYAPVTLLSSMLVTLVSPILFHRAGDAGNEQRLSDASTLTRKILVAVLVATSIIFLGSLRYHALAFRLATSGRYAGVSYLAPWLVLSAGLFAAGQVLALDRMSRLDTMVLIAPKVITALVGGGLNILGAYLYGMRGLVAASLVFSAGYLSWLVVLNRQSAWRYTSSQHEVESRCV